jgi:hypothetical protein
VRLEESVLVRGAWLDVAPLALEDVLARADEAAGSLDAALVHRVRGHIPILAENGRERGATLTT